MGYSRDIYESAEKKLYEFRKEAQNNADRKREMFYSRFPRAKVLENKISLTAIRAAKAVIRGADVKKELEELREKNLELRNELTSLLKSVNLPDNYLDTLYRCSKCSDQGFIDGIMCKCMSDLLKKEAYDRLNRESPLSLCTFESFSLDFYSDIPAREGGQSPRRRMSLILDYCRGHAKKFGSGSPGLLMRGSTGLGKTHLSLAIANEVIKKGFGVIYVSTQNMATRLEKEKFRGIGMDVNSEELLIGCELLIIDDLGTEFSTNFSNAAIYNIVNSRIMKGNPTIISTNLSMKELERSYTERMVSRIIGNNIQLEFFGTDIRQKKIKMKKDI